MKKTIFPHPEIKRLQLRTKHLVRSGLSGGYRSAFRGSGLVFSELRSYQPGDDVKRIDWQASARSGNTLVKSYEEDRHLSMIVLLDTSLSTGVPLSSIAGQPRNHQDQEGNARAQLFASLVVSVAMQHGDEVGLCLCGGSVEEYRAPKRTRSHGQATLERIATYQNKPVRPTTSRATSDLRPGIDAIMQHQRKRGIVFIISDFFLPDCEHHLRRIAHRHDTICVQLRHPFAASIPSAGIVSLIDPESGTPVLIDTSSRTTRRAVQETIARHEKGLAEVCRRSGIELITIDRDPVAPFVELLRTRMARIR
jgi:uncharacterized protein (DUF58 family)